MARETMEPGDRVVTMQVAGVCTVVARRGRYLELQTPHGRPLIVVESAVRKVERAAGEPVKGG